MVFDVASSQVLNVDSNVRFENLSAWKCLKCKIKKNVSKTGARKRKINYSSKQMNHGNRWTREHARCRTQDG
jgi:hypothetical protein